MRETNCLRLLRALGVAALMLSIGAPAWSWDYQFHGYADQGLLWSSDNNYFGHSTTGSLDYYEVGLNGTLAVRPDLLLSAQGAIRTAGATDSNRPRLDFALADYRFLTQERYNAGVRVGKVKNPVGFFNETRDDVFTRPSILLPSAYGDNQGQRNLIYGSPGAQLYGDLAIANHDLSAVGTISANHHLTQQETGLLISLPYNGSQLPSSLQIVDSWNFQVMDTIDDGRWQIAYSHFFGRFLLNAAYPLTPPLTIGGHFDVGLDFLSVRYNGEKFTITGEYALNPNADLVTLGGMPVPSDDTRIVADSGYLQGDYRLGSSWTLTARADAFFANRNDRSGTEYAADNPGTSRYSRFAYNYMVGAHWRHGEHWGVWGEYHWIDGSATVQPLDNVGRVIANRWSMLALMAGYTF